MKNKALNEYKQNLRKRAEENLLNLKGATDDFSEGQRSIFKWVLIQVKGETK